MKCNIHIVRNFSLDDLCYRFRKTFKIHHRDQHTLWSNVHVAYMLAFSKDQHIMADILVLLNHLFLLCWDHQHAEVRHSLALHLCPCFFSFIILQPTAFFIKYSQGKLIDSLFYIDSVVTKAAVVKYGWHFPVLYRFRKIICNSA